MLENVISPQHKDIILSHFFGPDGKDQKWTSNQVLETWLHESALMQAMVLDYCTQLSLQQLPDGIESSEIKCSPSRLVQDTLRCLGDCSSSEEHITGLKVATVLRSSTLFQSIQIAELVYRISGMVKRACASPGQSIIEEGTSGIDLILHSTHPASEKCFHRHRGGIAASKIQQQYHTRQGWRLRG